MRATGVLHPQSRARVLWDVVLLVMVCYTVAAVPLVLSFGFDVTLTGLGRVEQHLVDGVFAVSAYTSTAMRPLPPLPPHLTQSPMPAHLRRAPLAPQASIKPPWAQTTRR